jgi:hypothetical protein
MRLYLTALAEDCLPPPTSFYGPHSPRTVVLKQHGYPGDAWAYRREAWNAIGGLMNRCIVGAADHHMAQALLELWQPGEPRGFSQAYDQDIDSWSMRARTTINRDVGLVPGLAVHYLHGKIADRKHQDRPRILERDQYDPMSDVSYNRSLRMAARPSTRCVCGVLRRTIISTFRNSVTATSSAHWSKAWRLTRSPGSYTRTIRPSLGGSCAFYRNIFSLPARWPIWCGASGATLPTGPHSPTRSRSSSTIRIRHWRCPS